MSTVGVWLLLLAFQSNFYEQGMKALEEQRYQAAVENLTNAVAAEPKDFSLHFNLALAYSLWGKDAQAIPEYQKALELKPDLYQANLNLGILLIKQMRPAEAQPYLKAALAAKPKEYRPNYYLAEALLAAGDFAGADQTFQTALDLNPKSAAAESGLARAEAKLNRLDQAAPHFRKAADLDPAYRDGLLELASLYEAADQSSEAIAIYEKFPENAGAQERIGALLLKSGRAGDAVSRLETAVAQSPTIANRAALASAYLKNKQADMARPIIEQLLKEQPNDYDLRMALGRIERDARKFADAAQDFFRATQMKPDSSEAWSELAGALVLAESYPAALSALDRLAALHSEKPGHVYLRAIVLDKIKQYKLALASYERFLAMSQGQSPEEEFKARQRARIIKAELSKR
jgi:tetratricopeptide (TPR) repeat protein